MTNSPWDLEDFPNEKSLEYYDYLMEHVNVFKNVLKTGEHQILFQNGDETRGIKLFLDDFQTYCDNPAESFFGRNIFIPKPIQENVPDDWPEEEKNTPTSIYEEFVIPPFDENEIEIFLKRNDENEVEELKKIMLMEWHLYPNNIKKIETRLNCIKDGFLLYQQARLDFIGAHDLFGKEELNPLFVHCIQQCIEKSFKSFWCLKSISQKCWMLKHNLEELAFYFSTSRFERFIYNIASRIERLGWIEGYVDSYTKAPICLSVRTRYPRWNCPTGLEPSLTPTILLKDIDQDNLIQECALVFENILPYLINAYNDFWIEFGNVLSSNPSAYQDIFHQCIQIEQNNKKYFSKKFKFSKDNLLCKMYFDNL